MVEHWARRKPIYSATITQHGKAKRQQQLIQKTETTRTLQIPRPRCPPTGRTVRGGVNSRALGTRASETQTTPATRHYDRSQRNDRSLRGISDRHQQRHRYPDKNSDRPRHHQVTSKTYTYATSTK